MALVIVDHGYRIQTPVKFSRRGVEQLTQLQRSRSVPHDGQRLHAPDQELPKVQFESPAARQAHRAYSQTATLQEPGKRQRPRLSVAQVMTAPVFTIRQGSSLTEAWTQMNEHQVHQLAVINDEGLLYGLLSDRDLLLRTSPLAQPGPVASDLSIEGSYQTQLVVATPDTEARLVALVLLEHHINAIPVLSDSGDLVGIVTRSDLLHLIANDPDLEHWA